MSRTAEAATVKMGGVNEQTLWSNQKWGKELWRIESSNITDPWRSALMPSSYRWVLQSPCPSSRDTGLWKGLLLFNHFFLSQILLPNLVHFCWSNSMESAYLSKWTAKKKKSLTESFIVWGRLGDVGSERSKRLTVKWAVDDPNQHVPVCYGCFGLGACRRRRSHRLRLKTKSKCFLRHKAQRWCWGAQGLLVGGPAILLVPQAQNP